LIRLGKRSAEALIDSGAVCSMISQPFAQQLKLKIQPPHGPQDKMIWANGSRMKIVGTVAMDLYLKGAKIEHVVVVADNLTPNFVLGMNMLIDNHANLNFAGKPPTLSLFDNMIEIPMRPRCDDTNCASVNRTVLVPPYSEAYLTVNTPNTSIIQVCCLKMQNVYVLLQLLVH